MCYLVREVFFFSLCDSASLWCGLKNIASYEKEQRMWVRISFHSVLVIQGTFLPECFIQTVLILRDESDCSTLELTLQSIAPQGGSQKGLVTIVMLVVSYYTLRPSGAPNCNSRTAGLLSGAAPVTISVFFVFTAGKAFVFGPTAI